MTALDHLQQPLRADVLPIAEILHTLCAQLSWSHFDHVKRFFR